MTKEEALQLIDDHKNKLINPVEMLSWVHLRVVILNISEDEWGKACEKSYDVLSR